MTVAGAVEDVRGGPLGRHEGGAVFAGTVQRNDQRLYGQAGAIVRPSSDARESTGAPQQRLPLPTKERRTKQDSGGLSSSQHLTVHAGRVEVGCRLVGRGLPCPPPPS
jgi:hypothetical protein